MLNPSSRLKGEKDMEKYEKARRLKNKVAKIREDYTAGTPKMLLFNQIMNLIIWIMHNLIFLIWKRNK